MMHLSLLVAAALIFFIGGVHSWLGERRLIGPLLSPERRAGMLERSAFARQVLRFAWHLTTLAWWGIAVMVLYLATTALGGVGRSVLAINAVMFLITAVVILVTSRGRHLAWPVFILIGGLMLEPVF